MHRLRTHRLIVTLVLVGLTFWIDSGVAGAQLPPHPSVLTFKPLTFTVPAVDRVVLKNGMVVYLREDHELPLFNAVAYIRTGAIYEPADKLGLADMTGTVMRTGGTKTMTGDEIDEALELVAGSVETSIGTEMGIASISVLKKDLDTGLRMFADVLMNPAFRSEKIDLKRKQMIEGLRRQNDNPGAVAARHFAQLVYGKTSPWARTPTVETVQRLTQDDLIAFHRQYVHPNNVIMGISGDFNKKDLTARLERVFSGWTRARTEFPPVPPVELTFKPSVNYIAKDINQTNIRIGHLGLKRFNPDRFAVNVMNFILGAGGFNSRLMREVRSNRGLAYSVGGRLGWGTDYGLFSVVCQTKVEKTIETITLIQDIIKGMQQAPVSDDELALAKETLINEFVFQFTSTHQIVDQMAQLEYYGYQDPKGYLDTYRDNLAKVTKEDVLRVAKTYLHPDKLMLLAVGNAERFDKPLSTFGTVQVIELEQASN